MTLKEDNASSYAKALSDILSRDVKTDNEGKFYGGAFNRKRVPLDSIFNYTNATVFANDVLKQFETKYPKLYKRYKGIIEDLATEYATAKMKTSKRVIASVVTESYFNY